MPLTRGSTTMLRPVMAAMVRATASMSALTKFSVTGSRDRWAWEMPGPLPAGMYSAHSRSAGMIEPWIPSRLASRVAPVGQVRTDRVQSGPWAFADQVDQNLGIKKLRDVVAGTHASVLQDDDCFADATAIAGEAAP